MAVVPVPSRLQPPIDARTQNTDGFSAQVWAAHHQDVSDSVTRTAEQLAVVHKGTVAGDEAPAGDVGEYLTASGSTALSSNVVATVATLTLTPGDWDVTGGVAFMVTIAASSHYGVGIDGALGTEIVATIPTGSGTWRLSAGAPVRRNVGSDTAVTLSALAGFSSGAVSATGSISARRMR